MYLCPDLCGGLCPVLWYDLLLTCGAKCDVTNVTPVIISHLYSHTDSETAVLMRKTASAKVSQIGLSLVTFRGLVESPLDW